MVDYIEFILKAVSSYDLSLPILLRGLLSSSKLLRILLFREVNRFKLSKLLL